MQFILPYYKLYFFFLCVLKPKPQIQHPGGTRCKCDDNIQPSGGRCGIILESREEQVICQTFHSRENFSRQVYFFKVNFYIDTQSLKSWATEHFHHYCPRKNIQFTHFVTCIMAWFHTISTSTKDIFHNISVLKLMYNLLLLDKKKIINEQIEK